jgi:signal transduction histidine kinase
VTATPRRWSIRRRVAGASALLTTLPAAIATVAGVTWLSRAVDSELRALVREELEELRVGLVAGASPEDDLGQIVPGLAADHPQVQMAFRLVDLDQRRVVAESGDSALLRSLPTLDDGSERRFSRSPEITVTSGGLYLSRMRVLPTTGVEMLLDGAQPRQRIGHYWTVGGATIALALVLGLAAAGVLSRRLRGMMTAVTEGLGEDHNEATAQALPEEFVGVQQRLAQMLAAVRSRAEKTEIFTAGLAHELRSPLQLLIGEAEVALMRDRDVATYKQLIERQLHEHHELARAIDHLLYACAHKAAHRPRHLERFSLLEKCELRLEVERRLAMARGIELEVESHGDTHMTGDREAMARLLRNLVNNAIRWSPHGGRVLVVLRGGGDEVTVEVHDSGPGVPPSERTSIFLPFRTSVAPDGRRSGFGLGLSIVKMTVDEHAGEVRIGDSPLGGARFSLVFPRGAAPQESRRENS